MVACPRGSEDTSTQCPLPPRMATDRARTAGHRCPHPSPGPQSCPVLRHTCTVRPESGDPPGQWFLSLAAPGLPLARGWVCLAGWQGGEGLPPGSWPWLSPNQRPVYFSPPRPWDKRALSKPEQAQGQLDRHAHSPWGPRVRDHRGGGSASSSHRPGRWHGSQQPPARPSPGEAAVPARDTPTLALP